jgi:uncharacterized tellurite resistance protein B-like protein
VDQATIANWPKGKPEEVPIQQGVSQAGCCPHSARRGRDHGMINRLKLLLASIDSRQRRHDELRLAIAGLLAEAVRLDGAIRPGGRTAIRNALARRFDLTPDEAAELAAAGEAKAEASTQIFGFTHIINRDLTPEEQIGLFEMLYEVIYADAGPHDYETNLMRRLGELIYVPDKDRGAARLRVLRRLGQGGG